jgi:hypothetical protein
MQTPIWVPTFSLRLELLSYLDQQIKMLAAKTFSAFTNEEMGTFRSRERRIHELEQHLASLPGANSPQTKALSF